MYTENRVTDAFLSHPRTSSILRSGLRVLEPLDNWCQWQYCLNKTNVWLILNYLWNFSICIKIDIALDYVSGSSKNDVTMTEQVSIIKRAKSIVRNSCQPLIDYQVWYALLCLPILATQRSPSELAHLVRNIWSSWVQYQVRESVQKKNCIFWDIVSISLTPLPLPLFETLFNWDILKKITPPSLIWNPF